MFSFPSDISQIVIISIWTAQWLTVVAVAIVVGLCNFWATHTQYGHLYGSWSSNSNSGSVRGGTKATFSFRVVALL